MKSCIPIPSDRVFSYALSLVRKAKSSILVTMNIEEELHDPLPNSYHTLLEWKHNHGVRIVRYGFGTKRGFFTLKRKYHGIRFYHVGSARSYQRMLIVDARRALFRLSGQTYYTDFLPLVTAFAKYALTVYNRRAV